MKAVRSLWRWLRGTAGGLPLIVAVVGAIPGPASAAAYDIELTAPEPLRDLLAEYLDLFRYRDRDDIGTDQLNFMVATVAEQVERLAATEGYFSTRTEVEVEAKPERPVVRLRVESGPRTTISAVDIQVLGPALLHSPRQVEQVRQSWPLPVGEPFRQEEWSEAKQTGLQILQRRRFAAARLTESEARIDADRSRAELAVAYDSGPVFTLGEPSISGSRRYPETIIRNVNPLQLGEEYSAERLLEFQRQILRTPYYSNAIIDIDDDPEQASRAPVNVRVTEFPTQRVRGGFGFTTDAGARIEGLYSHHDMFDRAWVLDLQARLEQRRKLGSAALSMPPRSGSWVDSVQGSGERTTLEGVDLRSTRVGVRRSRSTDRKDTAYAIEYYRDELQQLDGAALPADTVVEPGTHRALVASIAHTRRRVDNARFPRKGRIVSVQAGVALKGMLTDQTFVRLYGRLREYLPVGKRDLVILRAELGGVISKGGNAAIPASLLFRTGGTESVRGYGFQSIGNERDGTVYPTRYLATGGAEYVHWFSESWGGALFYDVGVATDRWSDRSLYHAIGIGARWSSPVGRVNVDLAYGVQDNRVRPHLSLGVAF